MKEFKPELQLKKNTELEIIKKLPNKIIEKKFVLGMDIYKYSKYPSEQQNYIPVIFNYLYNSTIKNISIQEKFIFQNYGFELSDFKKNFISTGDGGFQIFDNAIQAITFALFFQTNLKRYCTGGSKNILGKNLYKIVKTLDLRFAITYDSIFAYENNFFGSAIINNARVMSKDHLNRLLIDSNSINWLAKNINSTENLMILKKSDFKNLKYFEKYDMNQNSFLFKEESRIKSVDLLRIGTINAKSDEIDIYNLHIQAIIGVHVDHQKYNKYVISLGNLNTSGIND